VPDRTGELLVAQGRATPAQIERARVEGRARGEPICTRLLAAGIDEAHLAAALSERLGVPGVDLSRSVLPLELLDLVPRAVAEGDLILPLSDEGDRIHLAMSNPTDERILAELRFVTGREVSSYVACRGALVHAVGEAYAAHARGDALWRGRYAQGDAPYVAIARPGGGEAPAAVAPEDAGIVIEVEPQARVGEWGLEEVEAEVVDAEELVEGELETAPAPRAAPLVLAVDDEPEIRQLVERTLLAKGYAVELAADGAEALEKAERLVPDLVLLDAMLPRVHGFEACRRIKASARTRDVPVIMMTAIYRGWRFAQDARDSYGAVDYVEKPFRLEDLLRRIQEALRAGAAAGEREPAESPPDPRLAAGKAHLAAGRVGEAVAALAAAVRANARSAEAQYALGRALRASGDAYGAMTAIERAVELAPRNLPSLRALAALYEETGFRRKAAEVLERALPAATDEAARSAIRKDLMRLLA
jgi:DNA-binding response OmpR family regulator